MDVRTAADYAAALRALLPPGRACAAGPGTVWAGLLSALAEELARHDVRCAQLAAEADPRTTVEMLADWEALLGLPTPCMDGETNSESQRRAAVVEALTARTGQTPADYVAIAAALGFAVTVTEFRPWTPLDPPGSPIYGDAWAYTVRIAAPATTVRAWTPLDSPGLPLRWWGNTGLECALARHRPAHTILQVAYGG